MKKYVDPQITIITLTSKDVITLSVIEVHDFGEDDLTLTIA